MPLVSLLRLGLHAGLLAATFACARWCQDGAFAATLVAILLAHEMGHWTCARAYGVQQSLPYFIPAPTLFGTLGAVIVMRSQPPQRSALLHIAVAGPYAGMLVALPALAWGLRHSLPNMDTATTHLELGESLLFTLMRHACGPPGDALSLHPVGLAGWAGLFITSLNLIPAGQLDGGHVVYALLGRWHAAISWAVAAALGSLGAVAACWGSPAGLQGAAVWLLWGLLIVVPGVRHPPVGDPQQALMPGATWHGVGALLLLGLTFMPVPLRFV